MLLPNAPADTWWEFSPRGQAPENRHRGSEGSDRDPGRAKGGGTGRVAVPLAFKSASKHVRKTQRCARPKKKTPPTSQPLLPQQGNRRKRRGVSEGVGAGSGLPVWTATLQSWSCCLIRSLSLGTSTATTLSHGDNAPHATPASPPRQHWPEQQADIHHLRHPGARAVLWARGALGRHRPPPRLHGRPFKLPAPAARQRGRRLLLAVARALPANPGPLLLHRRFGARPPGGAGAEQGPLARTRCPRAARGRFLSLLSFFPTPPSKKNPPPAVRTGRKRDRYFSGK